MSYRNQIDIETKLVCSYMTGIFVMKEFNNFKKYKLMIGRSEDFQVNPNKDAKRVLKVLEYWSLHI